MRGALEAAHWEDSAMNFITIHLYVHVEWQFNGKRLRHLRAIHTQRLEKYMLIIVIARHKFLRFYY